MIPNAALGHHLHKNPAKGCYLYRHPETRRLCIFQPVQLVFHQKMDGMLFFSSGNSNGADEYSF